MKIVNKIFVSLFASSVCISSASLLVAYRSYSAHLEEQFVERYDTFSQVLSDSLTQLELQTDLLMSVASQVFQEADRDHGPQSAEALTALASKLNMSHLFVVDAEARFIRSTNEDTSKIPNIYSFCSSYR